MANSIDYKLGLRELLQITHPQLQLSSEAESKLEEILKGLNSTLIERCSQKFKPTNKNTVLEVDVALDAVNEIFAGSLKTCAVAEGNKAVFEHSIGLLHYSPQKTVEKSQKVEKKIIKEKQYQHGSEFSKGLSYMCKQLLSGTSLDSSAMTKLCTLLADLSEKIVTEIRNSVQQPNITENDIKLAFEKFLIGNMRTHAIMEGSKMVSLLESGASAVKIGKAEVSAKRQQSASRRKQSSKRKSRSRSRTERSSPKKSSDLSRTRVSKTSLAKEGPTMRRKMRSKTRKSATPKRSKTLKKISSVKTIKRSVSKSTRSTAHPSTERNKMEARRGSRITRGPKSKYVKRGFKRKPSTSPEKAVHRTRGLKTSVAKKSPTIRRRVHSKTKKPATPKQSKTSKEIRTGKKRKLSISKSTRATAPPSTKGRKMEVPRESRIIRGPKIKHVKRGLKRKPPKSPAKAVHRTRGLKTSVARKSPTICRRIGSKTMKSTTPKRSKTSKEIGIGKKRKRSISKSTRSTATPSTKGRKMEARRESRIIRGPKSKDIKRGLKRKPPKSPAKAVHKRRGLKTSVARKSPTIRRRIGSKTMKSTTPKRSKTSKEIGTGKTRKRSVSKSTRSTAPPSPKRRKMEVPRESRITRGPKSKDVKRALKRKPSTSPARAVHRKRGLKTSVSKKSPTIRRKIGSKTKKSATPKRSKTSKEIRTGKTEKRTISKSTRSTAPPSTKRRKMEKGRGSRITRGRIPSKTKKSATPKRSETSKEIRISSKEKPETPSTEKKSKVSKIKRVSTRKPTTVSSLEKVLEGGVLKLAAASTPEGFGKLDNYAIKAISSKLTTFTDRFLGDIGQSSSQTVGAHQIQSTVTAVLSSSMQQNAKANMNRVLCTKSSLTGRNL